MKKVFLYATALCAFSSAHAVVNEQLSLENLMQRCLQMEVELSFSQILLTVRGLQDQACSGTVSLEQIKKAVEEQFGALKNIPNDDSEQSQILQRTLEIIKQAVAMVAEATRKNELPAVDARIFKKGIDAQATRLKVIEIIEEFFK